MKTNFTLEFENPPSQADLENYCRRHQKYYEENVLHAIAISLVHITLCPTAIFGNAAILITIWKTPSLHTPAYILLANLAMSDFAVGLIMQPLLITLVLSVGYGIPPSTFRFLCTGLSALARVLLGVSVLTITTIASDRLMALLLHLRYTAIVTTFRVSVVITTIWLLHGLAVLVSFTQTKNIETVIAIALGVILFVNFVIYLKIHLIARRHQIQIQQQQQLPEANCGIAFRLIRLRKSAVNTFLVFILLFVCYMPYICVVSASDKISSIGYHIATTMVVLNSSLNPLFYCWRVREIRAATKKLFCS